MVCPQLERTSGTLIYSRNHHKTFEGSVYLYCFSLKRVMRCSSAENTKPILVIILMEKEQRVICIFDPGFSRKFVKSVHDQQDRKRQVRAWSCQVEH